MKKYIQFIAILSIFLTSCEEIPPTFTPSTGERKVLIEEFTGVQCVQCPAGSVFIEDLLAQYGERLVSVSIHAGDFSLPYPQSQVDFRTTEGDQLLSFLGEPAGYPSAVVNRKLYPNQFDLQLGQGDWAGYIASELQEPPKVLLNITPQFDTTSRELIVEAKIFVEEDITESDVRIGLMITESEIQDLQLMPSIGVKPDYIHRHALRGMLTSYDGERITEPLTKGNEITKSFTYTLQDNWVPENCEVIAIISLAGTAKDVLQVDKAHVVE